jgi:hypothetical protein
MKYMGILFGAKNSKISYQKPFRSVKNPFRQNPDKINCKLKITKLFKMFKKASMNSLKMSPHSHLKFTIHI